MQPRNKCFLMEIDEHLEYLSTGIVLKLALGLYFQGLSSSITSNIITLPTLGKSVVVKNLPRNIIFYFSAFSGFLLEKI